MDLLDEKAKQRTEKKRNVSITRKIADLIKERQYHESPYRARTPERIEEINREIAEEENRRWQLQQNDWARGRFRRKPTKNQIDALREIKGY